MLPFELDPFFYLGFSLSKGSSECVQLLIDVGANLEAHDCHFGTPLHVACAREHLDCAKLLLKAGMAATGFASGWPGDGGDGVSSISFSASQWRSCQRAYSFTASSR